MEDTNQKENADPRKDYISRWECLKVTIGEKLFKRSHPDIHQSNTLAKGGGKRMQDIHSGDDPFCESVTTILGLAECGDMVSKDGENSIGGIARLKAGEERMRHKVFLCFAFVGFQRSVENGDKAGL
jgi:hypothetical protein